jgi:hypothetical protein
VAGARRRTLDEARPPERVLAELTEADELEGARGQLDRQREAIELAADVEHRLVPRVEPDVVATQRGAVAEQHGSLGRHVEGADRADRLTHDEQRPATGRHDSQFGA